MFNDPIVKDVRYARLEIENEFVGDFRRIYERALKIQKGIGNGETGAGHSSLAQELRHQSFVPVSEAEFNRAEALLAAHA